MARTYDDACFTCGRLVLREEGVAFRDGRIADLPCFVNGASEKHHISPDASSVQPNQRLFGVYVLIVDDNNSTLEVVRAALEYSGAFVCTATDATEGKAMLREVHPHVIVSDIAMPNDGLEIVREVIMFATETGLVVPAVAISAGADGRDHLREAGFAAFIPKPLDPFVLADVVAKLAQGRKK
jgi:CheY-like chemotaxis protein